VHQGDDLAFLQPHVLEHLSHEPMFLPEFQQLLLHLLQSACTSGCWRRAKQFPLMALLELLLLQLHDQVLQLQLQALRRRTLQAARLVKRVGVLACASHGRIPRGRKLLQLGG
jgi:hypothetical protein